MRLRPDDAKRSPMARAAVLAAAGAAVLTLANCTTDSKLAGRVDPKYGVSSSPRVVEYGQPVPRGGGVYRIGRPYQVAGRTYVPQEDPNYVAEGLASWYGDDFHGRLTANGEVYDMDSLSAAHPTLPMPSYVRVTNLKNQRSIVVRVNDRGPYHQNRVIDLSVKTAKLLGFYDHGVAKVRVEYVGRAPIEGSDDRQLMATLRDGEPAPAPGIQLASAKPFVPDAAKLRQVRGVVPVPDSRPYDLGEPRADEPQPNSALAVLRTPAKVETAKLDPVLTGAPHETPATKRVAQAPKPTAANPRVEIASVKPSRTATPPAAAKPTGFDNRWQGVIPASGTLAPPAPALGAIANAAPTPAAPAAAPADAPVSAYAQPRYNVSPGYVTGRGLY